MKALKLPPVRVALTSQPVLEARARALASGELSEEARVSERSLVRFTLGESPCAVELGLVARAVTKLGEVAPLASATRRVRGVAFVDNLPYLVADLVAAAADGQRSLEALGEGPALVIALETGGLALCVQGPIELTEGRILPVVAGLDQQQRVQIDGRLEDGTLLLSSEWLQRWATTVQVEG